MEEGYRPRIIAVDFDGCPCRNDWPNIGLANLDVIEELNSLDMPPRRSAGGGRGLVRQASIIFRRRERKHAEYYPGLRRRHAEDLCGRILG